MTEIKETKVEVSGESKFTRAMLLIVSVCLIFIGPTYIPYAMTEIVHAGAAAADVIGFVLFLAGMAMLVYVFRKRIIT